MHERQVKTVAVTGTKVENICCAGSPEEPVKVNGKTVKVGQCNNFWIFPGVGFGAVMSKSKKVTVSVSHCVRSAWSVPPISHT